MSRLTPALFVYNFRYYTMSNTRNMLIGSTIGACVLGPFGALAGAAIASNFNSDDRETLVFTSDEEAKEFADAVNCGHRKLQPGDRKALCDAGYRYLPIDPEFPWIKAWQLV